MMIKIKLPQSLKFIILALVFTGLGVISTQFYLNKKEPAVSSASQEVYEDKYLAFISEIYDKLVENYWEKTEEKKFVETFVLAIEKLTGQPQNLKRLDKQNLIAKIDQIINQDITDEAKKKEFVVTMADMVLANMQPFGRSRLYMKKDEQALRDNVQNKTETDYYQILGVDKDANLEEINQAVEEKKQIAEKDPSLENKQILEQAKKAQQVLTDDRARQLYDTANIAPTMEYELISPEIFYIHLTKFSPTTLEELQRVTEKVDSGDQLDTLIFDLRDNIGGAIDGLPYFLGPFIGNNQYAYQFYHQGEEIDYKTKIGWMPSLVRYKKVIILINENAQSSAEVMASVLKKYNVGVLVGRTTKGWGTVEKVFKLDNQIDKQEEYSMFLVHSVTLRADGQPIEGRGVDPTINIDDPTWKQQLFDYFNDQKIVNAVEKIWNQN